MSALSDLEVWISNHQAIVATVGVPLLTLAVTLITSRASDKRIARDRELERLLQRELKLADFRRGWIEELRCELAEFNSLAIAAVAGKTDLPRMSYLLGQFQMKLNTSEEMADLILRNAWKVFSSVSPEDESTDISGSHHHDFCEAAKAYLKNEWRRLKKDALELDAAI